MRDDTSQKVKHSFLPLPLSTHRASEHCFIHVHHDLCMRSHFTCLPIIPSAAVVHFPAHPEVLVPITSVSPVERNRLWTFPLDQPQANVEACCWCRKQNINLCL